MIHRADCDSGLVPDAVREAHRDAHHLRESERLNPAYRGRFAPTPSGPLHLGSLYTALAGYLQARAAGGRWLLRIDDLDHLRCVPGASQMILRQLEDHALSWDDAPRYQSAHLLEYESAVAKLRESGALYACGCSRSQLAAQSLAGPDGAVYAGTCREAACAGRCAWRYKAGTGLIDLADRWLGVVRREVSREVGDFVVVRADGQVAYQLACVVDESAQNITEVVRGVDLLGSSMRQRLLQQRFALPLPAYGHLPVLVDGQGRKLSKQNRAAPLDSRCAGKNLLTCLAYLGQNPLADLRRAQARDIVQWGIENWRPALVPRTPDVFAHDGAIESLLA